MSAKANHFKLGLFLLGGVVLGLTAIVILSAGKLFERKLLLETYFDESVQGIDVGSKVKFRGVNVGRVRTIDFTRNLYELDKARTDRRPYVRVVAELRADALGGMAEGIVRENLQFEIESGLRVRLTLLGVTGTSYLDVDYFDPERYPALPFDWTPMHPYVPSAPGAFGQIVSTLEDVVAKLDQIDFRGLADKADRLLEAAHGRVEAIDTPHISLAVSNLLAETRASNRRLQTWLEHPGLDTILTHGAQAMTQLQVATANPALTNSLDQLERTVRRLDRVLAGADDPLHATLDNLRTASENLRELTDNVRRHPAQLLFGEPPRPSRTNP
jgi:ABC-type transporter Mla subunit MlaD